MTAKEVLKLLRETFMKARTYLAVFEMGGGPGVSVYFPDVPGCITCGDDFDHALAMAKEVLSFYLESETPPPRTDKLPALAEGDLVVPITVYPYIAADAITEPLELAAG